jgi:hypothetical protein
VPPNEAAPVRFLWMVAMATQTNTTSTSESAPPSQLQTLAIAKITRHPRLQSREWLNPSIVAEYSEAMEGGDQFPPLLVFSDGNGFLLVDGYLRLEAAQSSGLATLRCEVRQGDFRDAILASAAVNATHGHRRTNADKRIAVGKLLQDPEWAKWSDCEIARRCKVSDVFVGRLRDSLTPNVRSERSYITKHSTVAAMNITAIGRRQKGATPTVRILSRPDDRESEVLSLTAKPHEQNVVSLADNIENYREQFVAALVQVEKLTANYPAMCIIHGNLGSDNVLAKRMEAVGRKHLDLAALLMRRPPDVGSR